MSQDQLKQVVPDMTPRYHPDVRELFRRADPETVFEIRVRTSEPVQPWESSNVTMIGDAELLCRKLVEAAHVPACFRTFRRVANALPPLERRIMATDAARRDHVDSAHEVVRTG